MSTPASTSTAATSTLATLKKHARPGSFDWSRIAPWRAARVTLGVVLPLVVGWLSGHVVYGAFMALGALPAGMASFQGETRSRVVAVIVATLGMAVSTFVGATAADMAPWSLVPIVALWAYVTGLSVSLGQRASVAVLQWSVSLLIAVGLPVGPAEAVFRAGLVLAGGLLQALLVAASWTLRPGGSERAALAASYGDLASYASGLAQGRFEAPPPTAAPARAALADANPLLAHTLWVIYVNLLEETERIRSSLAALAAQATQLEDASDVRALMAQATAVLRLVAQALTSSDSVRAVLLRDLDARLASLSFNQNTAWRWSGETLLGQLRAVVSTIGDFEAPTARLSSSGAAREEALTRRPNEVASWLATLLANVGIATEAGRHALRLAVVATLAEVTVQAVGLYQGRWVTLTILLILKPDYSSTFQRGIGRALGTAVGAAAGGAVAWFFPSTGGLILGAGIAIAAAYALFDVSYMLFSVLLTTYIVVLLVLLGMPAIPTSEARFVDTFIGAAMALTAYLVWPTWERTNAQEKFARLIESHRDYATALLGGLAGPGGVTEAELRALQTEARRARSDAEAATTRLAGEPVRGHFAPEVAQLLSAAVARLALAELALHALVLSPHPAATSQNPAAADSFPRIDELKTALATAMSRIVVALRAQRAPEAIPALRPIYHQLSGEPGLRDSALLPILDRLVDATNTLDAIVRQHFTEPARPTTALLEQ